MSLSAFCPLGLCFSQVANIGGSLPTPIQITTLSGMSGDTMLIWNSTSTNVFLGWGATSALATANAVIPIVGTATQTVPIPGNTVQSFRIPANSFVCGITAAGTSALYFISGDGI